MHVETTCENPFGKPYSYDDGIDVLDVKENLSQLLYDRVLDTGRDLGPVEYEILRNNVGVGNKVFQRIIQSLENSGLVVYPDDQRLRIDDEVKLTFSDQS